MSDNGGSVIGLLSYETLVHAVAGAMGSVTAMTVFFPLDTAKSRLQGVVNVILTTPMWVVNTRLKLQGAKFRNEDLQQTQYRGIFDAFSQIIANEGVGTLWNGTLPSLILVLNPALQFMFYEALKRKAGKGGKKISSAEIFLIGAIAKAIATTATYPLQTVQAILRFGQYKGDGKSGVIGSISNIFSLLMDRIKRYGVLGLYKGLEAKLLQTVLTAALMFVVYEKITATTFKVMGLNKKLKQ
ncbi:peroxisomal membrane protein PMP34 isoform X2 [Enoplosus armatus]|uniref:peroxisomal membrane protein PMP34 isoform X2 n=1 Tax=Enoplosus armatus TaxID=215367 RepID=UPI00399291A8